MRKQLLVASAILLTSGLAQADRSKFFLAGGVGLGTNSVKTDENLDAENGLVGSLKIGGLINNQHAIYFHRQLSWFSFDNGQNQTLDGYSGISAVGYTYYLNPEIGSPYFETSIGLGDFYNIDGDQHFTGNAFLIGAGYELNKHVQFGASFEQSNTEYELNSEFEITHRSIAAKVEFKL